MILLGALRQTFAETVYADGGFEFRLYPDADSPTLRAESREYMADGVPEAGYVSADGEITPAAD